MSTEYRPHIWKAYGNWKCASSKWDGVWPIGIGNDMFEAFADWERRWKIERGM